MQSSDLAFPFNFDHSYAEQLPGFYVSCDPAAAPNPTLLQFNTLLAQELGLDCSKLSPETTQQIFSGTQLPSDARPIAQAYAGHQFGNFVPQLGDGRALLLGEVLDPNGSRFDIALKGSGITPFSRGGDGKAAVGPVLREYLISEAMHALGIPTTRTLAAVSTGATVMRERPLPGAVLTRVAASHIRTGTFQYFAARGQTESVRQLTDYVIQRHYPEVSDDTNPCLSLLKMVVRRQALLIARWMLVGFIHGVMNTDNMAISGETIDYGPCAFMETYEPDTVFSSIDHTGRYAYGNQPDIALWNLARFAETLLPIMGSENTDHAIAEATAILETFMPTFQKHWYNGSKIKLGLKQDHPDDDPTDEEREFVDGWFEMLTSQKADFTLSWRYLAEAADGKGCNLTSVMHSDSAFEAFMQRWSGLLGNQPDSRLAAELRAANPIYIPRNHLVEEALAAAVDANDLAPFEKILHAVQNPFDEDPGFARYAAPASNEFTANYRTFCGT